MKHTKIKEKKIASSICTVIKKSCAVSKPNSTLSDSHESPLEVSQYYIFYASNLYVLSQPAVLLSCTTFSQNICGPK